MFSKFLKKDAPSATAEPAALSTVPSESEWECRLQGAQGNDAALLALLKEAPSTEAKISAVLALSGEDALRQAEREFRTHDRRVHSAAKQCYERLVKQRVSRARADELIEAAAALGDESMIPANRLVELDQAWRALDADLLEDDQVAKFADLQSRLAEQVRDYGERKRSVNRWSGDARHALAKLAASHAEVATTSRESHELLTAIFSASAEARGKLSAIPALTTATASDASTIAALTNEIQLSLQLSALIEARLAILDELRRGIPPEKVAVADNETVTPAARGEAPMQRWQSLAPIPDPRIANALDSRFDEWLRSQDEARNKRDADKRHRAQEKSQATHQARIHSLIDLINTAETALAEGHLAEAAKHLPALQAASEKSEAGAALQARANALQAEIIRLKGWQHWGGGRVREDLVEEAEVLARSVAAADGVRAAKVPAAQLEKYIDQLRGRWKELDRLGGATGKPLWQRFDTALKSAYLPVAAHKTRLNEARLENLAARESLLATLDALNIDSNELGSEPDWKAIALALGHFQTEWRKLGPLEHNVPHKRQAALTQRMNASVARLEKPLQEVRHAAQAEREALVVRAGELSRNARDRDVVGKIRELQGQWQRHARSLPLPRSVENALWAKFKAATDAVMSERDAAYKARNAEFQANQTTRGTLIGRLQALEPDTPPAEIKRVLAEVDMEWRNAGEAGKDKTAKLDARFREARDTARQHLAGSAQRQWNGTCNALVAKLALCVELEASVSPVPSAVSDIEARWAALPVLPSLWEQALQARFNAEVDQANSATGEMLDKLLLQLESALDIPSPASAEGARRAAKLMAMKNALEGRKSVSPAQMSIEKMTTAAFGCRHLSEDQHHRLEAIIAALRLSGPGILRG